MNYRFEFLYKANWWYTRMILKYKIEFHIISLPPPWYWWSSQHFHRLFESPPERSMRARAEKSGKKLTSAEFRSWLNLNKFTGCHHRHVMWFELIESRVSDSRDCHDDDRSTQKWMASRIESTQHGSISILSTKTAENEIIIIKRQFSSWQPANRRWSSKRSSGFLPRLWCHRAQTLEGIKTSYNAIHRVKHDRETRNPSNNTTTHVVLLIDWTCEFISDHSSRENKRENNQN